MAVNFSVSAVIKGVTLLPSSHRRSACNVPTYGKIYITTAQPEGKAHGQLCFRATFTNVSATSVVFIKIRNRLIFSCYFNHRVPDSRNSLRVLFYICPSSKVLQTDVGYSRDTACRVRLQFGAKRPSIFVLKGQIHHSALAEHHLPQGKHHICEADASSPRSGIPDYWLLTTLQLRHPPFLHSALGP